MDKSYKSARIKKETHKALRMMSAELDKSVIDLIDEAVKLLKEEQNKKA
jgi:hypothetical protein